LRARKGTGAGLKIQEEREQKKIRMTRNRKAGGEKRATKENGGVKERSPVQQNRI